MLLLKEKQCPKRDRPGFSEGRGEEGDRAEAEGVQERKGKRGLGSNPRGKPDSGIFRTHTTWQMWSQPQTSSWPPPGWVVDPRESEPEGL